MSINSSLKSNIQFAQINFNGSQSINYNNANDTEVEFGNSASGDIVSLGGFMEISTSDLNKKKIKFNIDGTVFVSAMIRVNVQEPITSNLLSVVSGNLILNTDELISDNNSSGQVELVGAGPDAQNNIYVTVAGQDLWTTLHFSFITRVMAGHRLQLRLRRGAQSSTSSIFNVISTDTLISAQYLDFTRSYINNES